VTTARGGRVIVVGSLNVDYVAHVIDLPRPGETVLALVEHRYAGGKGANQAVAAAAAGAVVTMVGAVGDDDEGRAYRRRLERLGIDAALAVVPHPEETLDGYSPFWARTGRALVTVNASGENAIVVVPGANHELSEADLTPLDDLGPGEVLLCQLEVPLPLVAAAVRRAAGRGARVVVNCAPFAVLPADVVALADPLVCNEHEAAQFADIGLPARSWLVTFGAAGCAWDGEQYVAPVVPAHEVVDTTGAGDAFCGALAAALARGACRDEAVSLAMSAGAEAVRRRGAQPDPVI
jgi:ribokinase